MTNRIGIVWNPCARVKRRQIVVHPRVYTKWSLSIPPRLRYQQARKILFTSNHVSIQQRNNCEKFSLFLIFLFFTIWKLKKKKELHLRYKKSVKITSLTFTISDNIGVWYQSINIDIAVHTRRVTRSELKRVEHSD